MTTRCFDLERQLKDNNYFGNFDETKITIFTDDNQFVSKICIDGEAVDSEQLIAWCDVYNLPLAWDNVDWS